MLKNSKWRNRVIVGSALYVYCICKDVNMKDYGFIYTTYTRVCQINFIYLRSILAKFVLFEYNHVIIIIERPHRESDFYDLG